MHVLLSSALQISLMHSHGLLKIVDFIYIYIYIYISSERLMYKITKYRTYILRHSVVSQRVNKNINESANFISQSVQLGTENGA